MEQQPFSFLQFELSLFLFHDQPLAHIRTSAGYKMMQKLSACRGPKILFSSQRKALPVTLGWLRVVGCVDGEGDVLIHFFPPCDRVCASIAVSDLQCFVMRQNPFFLDSPLSPHPSSGHLISRTSPIIGPLKLTFLDTCKLSGASGANKLTKTKN